MKKVYFIVAALCLLAACNSGEPKSADSATTNDSAAATTTAAPLTYAYTPTYSGDFEIGDPKYAQTILDIWKDFDNNTFDNSKDKFADTVLMLFPDMELYASRDSMIASTKAYRGLFKSVQSKIDAVMSVKSTDRNEDWVLVWGTEVHTNKKNVTDSVYLHEAWRLNKDGKVEYMEQFSRTPAKKK